jgi:RimJ/RimL family protein N-acetyltransferase
LNDTSLNLLPLRASLATVRPLRRSDLHLFRSYRSDAELAKFQGWVPMSESEALSFIESVSDSSRLVSGEWIQLGIADPSNDELLGDIGLFLNHDETYVEIGFTLCKSAQGHGIAGTAVTEALRFVFATTPVQTVRAVTDERNAPSIRLLERLRFRFVSKSEAIFKGEHCIEHTYELPRA